MEGASVEEVRTWRVSVWRSSTHGGRKCGGSPHRDPLKIAVQEGKPPRRPSKHTPDHRVHGHVKACMTGSTMKITIPDRPKTCHDQACELHSKMCLATWTFAACQFRGRFLGQRLQLVGAKTR